LVKSTKSPKRDLINRLNRVEGQIRGIKGMIDEERHCLDVLTQIWAASSALNKTAEILAENYVKECLVNDRESFSANVDELVKAIKALMN